METLIISLSASIITIIWTLFSIFKHKDESSMPMVLFVVFILSGWTAFAWIKYDKEHEECVKQKRNYQKELQTRKSLEVKYSQVLNLLNNKQEENVWLSLKGSSDPVDIEQYLINFPKGKYYSYALTKFNKSIKNSKDPLYHIWIKPLNDLKYRNSDLRGLYSFERYFFTNIYSEQDLERLSGLKILEKPTYSYGYEGFRNYNERFLRWVRDNLIPTEERKILISQSQGLYNKFFKNEVRTYYLAHVYLTKDAFNYKPAGEYQKLVKAKKELHRYENGKSYYLRDFFRKGVSLNRVFSKEIIKNHSSIFESDSFVYAISFWLRRQMCFDMDSEIILQIFHNLIRAYDKDFFKDFKLKSYV